MVTGVSGRAVVEYTAVAMAGNLAGRVGDVDPYAMTYLLKPL